MDLDRELAELNLLERARVQLDGRSIKVERLKVAARSACSACAQYACGPQAMWGEVDFGSPITQERRWELDPRHETWPASNLAFSRAWLAEWMTLVSALNEIEKLTPGLTAALLNRAPDGQRNRVMHALFSALLRGADLDDVATKLADVRACSEPTPAEAKELGAVTFGTRFELSTYFNWLGTQLGLLWSPANEDSAPVEDAVGTVCSAQGDVSLSNPETLRSVPPRSESRGTGDLGSKVSAPPQLSRRARRILILLCERSAENLVTGPELVRRYSKRWNDDKALTIETFSNPVLIEIRKHYTVGNKAKIGYWLAADSPARAQVFSAD